MFGTCNVCADVARPVQLLPDRAECDPPYRYECLCPQCLDAFLAIYPRLHQLLRRRELTGG